MASSSNAMDDKPLKQLSRTVKRMIRTEGTVVANNAMDDKRS